MVLLESMVSGHKMTYIRERLADKVELIRFDPYSKYQQSLFYLIRDSAVYLFTITKLKLVTERLPLPFQI